jgi:regulator of protease activity HflC (stomatin/prohibitin superfamily)
MKKIFAVVAAALFMGGCHYASIEPSEQGVKSSQPWFFGHGGVDDAPINPGSEIIPWSTSVIHISTTPTAFDIPFDNLLPSNRIPLDFHTTVRMQVVNAPELVKHWNGAAVDKDGNESNYWFWANIAPQYNTYVRQAARKYDMNQLVIGNGVELIEQEVTANLNNFIKANHMPVRLLSVTMGRAGVPQEILNQTTETVAQQQRKLTMDAQAQAEQSRKGAELARAEADNAYRTAMQQSPEQYIEVKRIEMLGKVCANENSHCIFGNATPLMNMNH